MALRKLQAEIDKTLKSVASGVEVFESTFDKLNHATNTTQKDKLENDLKTQIKKLQRMRDQIKAWLGSNEIKDKTSLLDNRKLIETQMERFKALEKEMKMKAFSKEGLIAQSRLDPAEKAKRDLVDWIGNTTDELSRQIEQTEAEAELLQTGKKKKAAGDRLGELDTLNERRQWHIGRLEVVQRMLENGQLGTEQVETIQEDVKYFVETNTEEDFDYDAGIYDELNLQDEEDFTQEFSHVDDMSNLDDESAVDPTEVPKTPAKEDKEKKTGSASKSTSVPPEEQPPSPVSAKKLPLRRSTTETKVEVVQTPVARLPAKPVDPAPSVVMAPAPTLIPASLPAAPAPPPKPAALPPIRYAAAAAAAVAGSAPAAPIPSVPAPVSAPAIVAASAPLPVEPVASPVRPKVELALAPPPQEVPEKEDALGLLPVEVSPIAAGSSATRSDIPLPQVNGHFPPPPGIPASRSPAPQIIAQPPAGTSTSSPRASARTSPLLVPATSLPSMATAPHAESSRAGSTLPVPSPPVPQGVLGSLMQSFEVAKQRSEKRAGNMQELNSALDASYTNVPQQLDAEPPRYYRPKNPVKTPAYYPQVKPPILDDKEIFHRFDLDQLFYIFYYMTGTYEQWLAARELKYQSWRFHKQYLTWFKRSHNPQAVTDNYEQGGYVYFDWENSWCQRKKSDFRFEYRWLSDH